MLLVLLSSSTQQRTSHPFSSGPKRPLIDAFLAACKEGLSAPAASAAALLKGEHAVIELVEDAAYRFILQNWSTIEQAPLPARSAASPVPPAFRTHSCGQTTPASAAASAAAAASCGSAQCAQGRWCYAVEAPFQKTTPGTPRKSSALKYRFVLFCFRFEYRRDVTFSPPFV